MGSMPHIPEGWTEPERWVWERIAVGELADLKARDTKPKDLDPRSEDGWGKGRRLSARFLKTIFTQRAFVEATPYGGIRIRGALVDDAPLNLEYARLPYHFWLEGSRILVDMKCRNLRVDGEFSLAQSIVTGSTNLYGVNIRESVSLEGATFKGGLCLETAKIGSNLQMSDSTVEGISNPLDGITVDGAAFLQGVTIKGELSLRAAKIGSNLRMETSTFEGELTLETAKIGSNLRMETSNFEGNVNLDSVTVDGKAYLAGATVKGELILWGAKIGSNLHMELSTFERNINLECVTVGGLVSLYSVNGNSKLTHFGSHSAI